MEVTITLPVETINACIAALAKLPYEHTHMHIDLLKARATESMQAAAQAAQQEEGAKE